MMYHKNRLIKAYERVGCQLKVSLDCFKRVCLFHMYAEVSESYHVLNIYLLQANNMGVGVIGVIECDFLDPTHNKQSFMETDKYR